MINSRRFDRVRVGVFTLRAVDDDRTATTCRAEVLAAMTALAARAPDREFTLSMIYAAARAAGAPYDAAAIRMALSETLTHPYKGEQPAVVRVARGRCRLTATTSTNAEEDVR